MDVTEAILKRMSIRKWKSRPVEREKIEKVLEAGRRAPSWGNSQPWRFIVTQDPTKKEGLAAAAGGQSLIQEAPVAIVCCGTTAGFTRKLQRESLKELMDVGALNWSTDVLDNVVLESDLFAPYRLGAQAMYIKACEQLMIAISYMTLEAVNQGLATCWVGAISASEAHKVMNLPEDIFVHDVLALGYADENPRPRPRKPMEQIAFWETYA